MLFIFYLLLMFRVGRCTDDSIFETKTVGVGDDVTLNCSRQYAHETTLYWIRLVSGNLPEFLGGAFTFDYANDNKTARITAEQGPGTFPLRIHKTQRSDTGIYYCMKVNQLDVTLLKGTFLRIKEPDITAIIQAPQPAPVRPGDSVTLQCSVLSESETTACPGDHSVYWFRVGSDESHPSFIYTHGNSGDECEKSPETQTAQKCVYSFSKNISSSDAETYYCAVATCGEILFGDGTKLDIKETSEWSNTDRAVIFLLCGVLVLSLIVTAAFIYTNKCDCCNAVAVQKNCGGWKSQRHEEMQVYSGVVFTVMRTDSWAIKDAAAAERERIYAAVKD